MFPGHGWLNLRTEARGYGDALLVTKSSPPDLETEHWQDAAGFRQKLKADWLLPSLFPVA